MESKHKIPESLTEISILLTDDKEIHRLNLAYRNKNKPTDVLSFAALEGNTVGITTLGDLVISLDTTKAQAKKYKVSFDDELTRLAVHGVLHLLGYDHEKVSKAKAQKMRRMEKWILEEIL